MDGGFQGGLIEALAPEWVQSLFENDTVKPTIELSPATTQIPRDALTHDQSVPEFLQGISHELRTPLNVIIGMCQFLERDRKTPLSPIHRDAVDRMERNARSLLQSVNHLIEKLRTNGDH